MVAVRLLMLFQAAALGPPLEPVKGAPGWVASCDTLLWGRQIDGEATDARGASLGLVDRPPYRRPCAVLSHKPADDYQGRRIRLSAIVRSASDDADGMELVVMIDGVRLPTTQYFENGKPATRAVRSAPNDGERFIEARVTVPLDASTITIGMILTAHGSVSAQRLRLQVLNTRVPAAEVPTIAMGVSQMTQIMRLDSRAGTGTRAPPALIARIDSVARQFQSAWLDGWVDPSTSAIRRSWRDSTARVGDSPLLRAQSVLSLTPALLRHCHPPPYDPPARLSRPQDPPPPPRYDISGPAMSFIIASQAMPHAMCPSWLAGPVNARLADEAANPDTVLSPAYRHYVMGERALLITGLGVVASAYASDDRILIPYVRFLVDQRDTAGALKAVAGCKAERWRCDLFAGYVSHWRGDMARADSLFVAGLRLAPAATRCQFGDVSTLLWGLDRNLFTAMPCAAREAVSETLWWLADPLYTERGNERRATHFARLMSIALHATIETDQPNDWDTYHGGDALREMIVRYGWPTSRMWGGRADDEGHYKYLGDERPVFFTTNEYSLDRFHTFPAWSTITHPFDAVATDWELTPAAALRADPDLRLWWPAEHTARARGPLVQFAEYQVALFRRDHSMLVGLAVPLDPDELGAVKGATARASLVTSVAPDSFEIHTMRAAVGTSAVVSAEMAPRPQIVGMEVAVDRSPLVVARTRFGVTPPVELSRLPANSVAVSDLAFLAPENAASASAPSPEAALRRMLGSTRLRRAERLSVYWETYGIAANDTMEVALVVDRLTAAPGLLRGLAQSIGLGREQNQLTTTWRATHAGTDGFPINAAVPAFGRHITLGLDGWKPGHYRMTLTVTRAKASASATRLLEILE